jgi:hypothetical protein
MSGVPNSKGKERAVELRPEANNAEREQHEPTAADEQHDEVEE